MKEDYVSFECAKLLKEKGFNEYVEWAYRYFAENNICVIHINEKPASTLIENCYPYVTLQMAMKWLRKVHKLHITIKLYGTPIGIVYAYEICKLEQHTASLFKSKSGFENNENAVEAAILECLTNLI